MRKVSWNTHRQLIAELADARAVASEAKAERDGLKAGKIMDAIRIGKLRQAAEDAAMKIGGFEMQLSSIGREATPILIKMAMESMAQRAAIMRLALGVAAEASH